MQTKIDPCDTMRNNLIAAALGLQQCTKTAANVVPLADGRVIAIGTPAQVRELIAAPAAACEGSESQSAPNSAPGDAGQDAAVAAIQYALSVGCDDSRDAQDFLRYWDQGEFDVIRRNWADVPEAVFIGADPLHPAARTPAANAADQAEEAMTAGDVELIRVPAHEADSYCRILTILGMEEEGDPVAEVQRLFDAQEDRAAATSAAGQDTVTAIVRDVCELDYSGEFDEEKMLAVTVDDLRLICSRHIVGDDRAAAKGAGGRDE